MKFNSGFAKIAGTLSIVALAGCSETSFKDAFDMGKVAPDETAVQQNRALTMPPDLQLRAPNGAAPAPQAANNAPPVSTQPPQYGTQQPQYGTQPPRQAYIPPAQQPAVQQPNVQRQDVYTRNGISKTRPDGTPKTQGELIEELRAVKKKRQQAVNPNYGTIFNLPKVWADGG